MRFVTTSVAARLTGLSSDQLREWTNRRALIPADVQRRGRGSPAQYTWQTVLLLRIAAVLKERFHLELHAHRELFTSMRAALNGVSFLRLWGAAIAMYDAGNWELLEAGTVRTAERDSLLLRLDTHLHVLTSEFGMPAPSGAGQLELFPARLIRDERTTERSVEVSLVRLSKRRRRA